MSNLRRSLSISFVDKYLGQLAAFVSTIILARLLTPQEIGIYSVGAAVVLVVQLLRDFGVTQYVIQHQELTEADLRSAMTVALMIGWGLGCILFFSASAIAEIYQQPGIEKLMQVLSISFFLVPFNSVTIALFRRDFQFDKVLKVNLASTVSHTLVVIFLAWYGLSYMSMAWASVAGVVAGVGVASILNNRKLSFRPNFSGVSNVAKFGGWMSASTITKQMGVAAPELIIGKALSMDEVGFFSRAIGTVKLFHYAVTSAIAPLALPLFSGAAREGADIKKIYLSMLEHVTALAWPFYGLLALMAYPIITILYGTTWTEAVIPAQVLCMWAAVSSVALYRSEVLTAVGKVQAATMVEMASLAAIVVLCVMAVNFGISAVAAALIIAAIIEVVVTYMIFRAIVGMLISDLWQALNKSMYVTIWSLLIPLVVFIYLPPSPDRVWLPLILSLCGSAIGWLIGVFFHHHPYRKELESLWGVTKLKLRPQVPSK